MKIYFIRHGETDHNKKGIAQGSRVDTDLNSTGIAQIKGLLEDVKKLNPDAIYSSPLQRARQSAEIIAKELGLKIIPHEGVKETDIGTLSGLHGDQIAELIGVDSEEWIKRHRTGQYDYRNYEGEHHETVESRLRDFVEYLKNETDYESVLVFTHGGVVRAAYRLYADQQPDIGERIANASINEFDIER